MAIPQVCKRYWCAAILFAPLVVGVAVAVYDGSQVIVWIGGTNLDVAFVIAEADSGRPIEGASVAVETFSERDAEPPNIDLVTDSDGVAALVIPGLTTTGRQSALRFTDTYAINLPYWRFRASAPGYTISDWLKLHEPGRGLEAKRVAPFRAKLVIPVTLRKQEVLH